MTFVLVLDPVKLKIPANKFKKCKETVCQEHATIIALVHTYCNLVKNGFCQ